MGYLRTRTICALAAAIPLSPCAADVRDEIIYQIMPMTWRDSDGDPDRLGDIGGLIAGLEYLDKLGISAVYLNPVFPSPAYHGYQHGDASQVNPRLGSREQLLDFVGRAHARGIKVYLDFVAYGISQESPWFRESYKNPSSQYSSWLAYTDPGNTKYQGYTYKSWNGQKVGFIHWNLDRPEPVKLLTSWACGWLDPDNNPATRDGVDGFRLDHAYAAAPEGWGATIGFWEAWCQDLRRVSPDVFIFAEPGDWSSYASDLLTPHGFDAAIAKPLEFAMRDALVEAKAGRLLDVAARTAAAVPSGKTNIAEINDHDSDRLSSVLEGDPAREKLAAAMLLTQPFPPNIYAGDEIGMRGRKANYGGDANDLHLREPFKWTSAQGPPMSGYMRLHTKAWENRVSRDHDARSVQEQDGVPGSLLEEYRKLINVRRATPALRRGEYLPIAATPPQIWAFLRRTPDQTVLVVLNLAKEAGKHGLAMPEGTTGDAGPVLASSAGASARLTGTIAHIEVPASGYLIIELRRP